MSAQDHDHDPSALEHVVDLLVHLPVGFALEFRRTAPQFIERGRRELAHSRAVAVQALHPATPDGNGRFGRLGAHAVGTLRALGVLPGPDVDDHAEVGRDRPGPTAGGTAAAGTAPRSGSPVEAADAAATPAAPVVPAGPGIDPDTLAIPDYDSLSASQVVPRLEGLADDELETVRRYEVGTRGRKTILNKIAQLQAG